MEKIVHHRWIIFITKKFFAWWSRCKCLELKNEICDHHKFVILGEELENEELSADCIVEKIHSTLRIPLLRIYRLYLQQKSEKAIFRMSSQIYCLQKVKYIKYKQIKGYKSTCDSNEIY